MSKNATIPRPSAAPSTATLVPVAERGVMHDVSWNLYDRLTDAIGERSSIRVAFDGKDVEIMVLGPKHERSKALLGLLIDYVSTGLEIDCEELGSTTWKRPELERGIEADQCYCFKQSKLEMIRAAAKRGSSNRTLSISLRTEITSSLLKGTSGLRERGGQMPSPPSRPS